MDLKGAEIRNILKLCMSIGSNVVVPLKVNIPYYQRPYRWDEIRITNLIDDFYKNKNDINNGTKNAEYFVGSVVLVQDSKIANKFDIIDGQQRVTTVFLLNYLRFLLQRAYIEELLSVKSSNIDGPLRDLERFYGDMFGKIHIDEFSTMRSEILSKMEPIFSLNDQEREQVFAEIEKLYKDTVYLPDKNLSNLDQYYEEYEDKLYDFLVTDELALTYDRKTFNEALIKALAKVCVIVSKDDNPKLRILGVNEKTDLNILQYTNAFVYEFNALTEHCDYNGKPINNTKELIDFISSIIEDVKFCVIVTGNERDAYTLFEVLNDRAMDIDDLELIKNLFLKAYCQTSGDSETLIDKNIGELDQIWGDEVFSRDLTDSHRKLISYLGMLYFTADENAFTNKMERYRETIEKIYLKDFASNTKPYSYNTAYNDIKVYQMIRTIIECYGLPVRNAASSCIRAEDNTKVSITYKTFHLLNALKYDGVLPALTNTIIRQYMDSLKSKKIKKVDISDFRKYIEAIRDDDQHNANGGEFKTIHEIAFALWKSALLAKDYEQPRTLAKNIIRNVSLKCNNISAVSLDVSASAKEYVKWIQEWKYGKSDTNDLRIKVFFITLFKTTYDSKNSRLIFDKAVYSFTTDKLQLDHMEAHNPSENNMEKHFVPSDPHETREKYINSLGNFMILDSENNNNKDNKPLVNAMIYYQKMCKNHWLILETTTLLDKYNTEVDIAGKKHKVPTEAFFNERATRLIKYFELITNRDLNQTSFSL